ncbi:MAG: hypothetical protein RMI34_02145 [Chloroherpetonaceae bacterium]|nr:hypothetical protein [Chloroherpetonaceae bacterium]MDW8018858.1 hypothetical protein [Chloroherpetonaceae bacterium]
MTLNSALFCLNRPPVVLQIWLYILLAWLLLSPAELRAQSSQRPHTFYALLLSHQGKWVMWDGAGLRNSVFKLKAVQEDYIALQWSEDKTGIFEYIIPLQSIHHLVLTQTDTLQLVTYHRIAR